MGFSFCQELALCCVITATPVWSVTVFSPCWTWYLLWDWQRGHPMMADLWILHNSLVGDLPGLRSPGQVFSTVQLVKNRTGQ